MLLPFLASCSLNDAVKKVEDPSKLYLGSYPTVRDSNGSTYSYHLYLRFSKEYEEDAFTFDCSINLGTDTTLVTSGFGEEAPRFVDVCSVFSQRTSGQELSDYFADGGFLEYWTGYDTTQESIRSAKSYCIKTGKVISLSAIAEQGETLQTKEAGCYKDEIEWRFWKW